MFETYVISDEKEIFKVVTKEEYDKFNGDKFIVKTGSNRE